MRRNKYPRRGMVCGIIGRHALMLPEGRTHCEWVKLPRRAQFVGERILYRDERKTSGLLRGWRRRDWRWIA